MLIFGVYSPRPHPALFLALILRQNIGQFCIWFLLELSPTFSRLEPRTTCAGDRAVSVLTRHHEPRGSRVHCDLISGSDASGICAPAWLTTACLVLPAIPVPSGSSQLTGASTRSAVFSHWIAREGKRKRNWTCMRWIFMLFIFSFHPHLPFCTPLWLPDPSQNRASKL